jgi:hypothetical protein
MPTSSRPPNTRAIFSPPVAAYVEATNSFDLEGLVAVIADDALVNDQLRHYWGKPAIREWAARDIIGQNLTMDVTTVIEHYGNFIVTATIVGDREARPFNSRCLHPDKYRTGKGRQAHPRDGSNPATSPMKMADLEQ